MSELHKVLIVEDSPDDADLTVRSLRRAGYEFTHRRVDTAEAMRAALAEDKWDLVIADYSMPRFSGLAALRLLRDSGLELPFILVSGTVGEDVAVGAMQAGADDYVLKSNLVRLPAAVERELREFEVRAERNRAEERYRNLVERVPVGLFAISPEGEVLESNPALFEMLGYPAGNNPKHLNIADSWMRPAERARLVDIIRKDGVAKNFEMELRRPDGSVIWCSQSARAVYDSAGEVAYYEGVLVDIDSRKRAEDEANRARDKVRDLALETAQLRADFMASMSHEIRTPLTGIISTAELLSQFGLDQDQSRLTDIIRSSGELLLTIVNDILDFSKLAAGRLELEKLDFDLVKLAKITVDSFAATARAKGIDLALEMDTAVPVRVRADQSRLRQVLSNLLANAIKFTNQGKVMVKVSRVEGSADDVLVRFEVIDTGIGVPIAAQRRLFQPFVQADGSTHRRFGGTGLGLVIAAKLTDQMGGEIGFESEPGTGSNFHFTVRLEKAAETETAVVRQRGPDGAQHLQWRKDVRVLLVDDNLVNRTVGARQLCALGYTTELADGANRALAILSSRRFDIVLMDCEMPEMDGYQAAAEIRRREGSTRHTVVIALSAHAMEGARERCLGAGMDDYLSKPVTLKGLADKIDSWARPKGSEISTSAN
jgi:PAS domain S-box-containing protein